MSKYNWAEAMRGISKVVDSMTRLEGQKTQVMGQLAQGRQDWFYKQKEMEYKQQEKEKDPQLLLAREKFEFDKYKHKRLVEQEEKLGDLISNYTRDLDLNMFPTSDMLMEHMVQLKIDPKILASNPNFLQVFAEKYRSEVEKIAGGFGGDIFKAAKFMIEHVSRFFANRIGLDFSKVTLDDTKKAIQEHTQAEQYRVQRSSVNQERVNAALESLKGGDAELVGAFKAQAPEAIQAGQLTQAEYETILKQLGSTGE